jgi:hypothetical protein
MTTRTLTVQADQRAYVPHALCIVKRTTLISKTCPLWPTLMQLGSDRVSPSKYHFRAFSLFTIWEGL